jgi:hypothetical protein
MKVRILLFALASVALLAPFTVSALIMSSQGNSPVQDRGWPDGSLVVANLQSRVGWWEGPPFGGGEWQFLYRGDTETFNEALTNFAAIRTPVLDLVIHDGPEKNVFLREGADGRVDWTFTIWNPAGWHSLYNNPKVVFDANDSNFRKPVDPPRLDVYIGGGQVDWTKVRIPANVHVRDERASASGVDLSGGSVIHAEFFDMGNGKPVSGAHLLVEKVSWQTNPAPHWEQKLFADAASDSSGRVQIQKIPADTIRISVSADSYAPLRLDQRAHGRPALLKFSIELAKVASIRGVVTDTEGKPIKGAKVRPLEILASNGLGYDNGFHYDPYESANVETDAAGHFEISGLPTGYAQLSASAPGYFFSDFATIHDVPATNTVLRLARAGGIQVSVTDKSGKALSRLEGNPLLVNVELKEGSKVGSWGGGATVKDDGTCQFIDVPPGEYRVTCRPNPSTTSKQSWPEKVITVSAAHTEPVKIIYE